MYIHGGDIYTYKNVADFSANINFRGMPSSVAEAARRGVDQCGNYPDPQCRRLRDAIGLYEDVPSEWIVCGNGAADLIFALVWALKPRKALVAIPTFYEYEHALGSWGCEIRKYRLQEKNDFQMQEDFLEQMEEETDLVFLCNPNNPTGALMEPEFLKRVLEKCQERDAILVLDECFNDFLERPEAYTMKDCLKESRNLFLLKAFTKMFAMAGLRLGYGITRNHRLLEDMGRMRQPWSVSIPAQEAGIAATREREFVEESRRAIGKEREFLSRGLLELGYRVLTPSANYVFFHGAGGLAKDCLAKGFLIRDCGNYEGLDPGWYRIAVKGRKENERLLEALRKPLGCG